MKPASIAVRIFNNNNNNNKKVLIVHLKFSMRLQLHMIKKE